MYCVYICIYVYMYIYVYEQPHLFTEKKSRLLGTVFWGPEVALPGKRDRNRTSNEINTHDVTHLLFVKAWIRLNEICQTSKITSKVRNEANQIRNRTLKYNIRPS